MNKVGLLLFMGILAITVNSCKKKEDALPRITFKSSSGYQVGGGAFPPKTSYTIGINLRSSLSGYENKTFKVTRSINGGPDSLLFSKDLSGNETDSYYYEVKGTTDSVWGNYYRYTFSAENEKSYSNFVEAKISTGE